MYKWFLYQKSRYVLYKVGRALGVDTSKFKLIMRGSDFLGEAAINLNKNQIHLNILWAKESLADLASTLGHELGHWILYNRFGWPNQGQGYRGELFCDKIGHLAAKIAFPRQYLSCEAYKTVIPKNLEYMGYSCYRVQAHKDGLKYSWEYKEKDNIHAHPPTPVRVRYNRYLKHMISKSNVNKLVWDSSDYVYEDKPLFCVWPPEVME